MNQAELKIQAEIVQYLQVAGIYAHSVPNEAAGRSQVAQMQLVSAGLRSGVADMVVWWPTGIGYVEVKKPGGKQTDAQKRFQQRCIDNGYSYDLVYSVQDVEKVLNSKTTPKQ